MSEENKEFEPAGCVNGIGEGSVELNYTAVNAASAPVAPVEYKVVEVPVSVQSAANNIGVIIPTAKGRKIVYSVYVGLSFVIANTVVAFSTVEAPLPDWLQISLAVLGNSAIAFGGLAIANADNGSKTDAS
jgi:hypothetical protein